MSSRTHEVEWMDALAVDTVLTQEEFLWAVDIILSELPKDQINEIIEDKLGWEKYVLFFYVLKGFTAKEFRGMDRFLEAKILAGNRIYVILKERELMN